MERVITVGEPFDLEFTVSGEGALDPVFGPQGDYWAASCRSGRHVVLRRAMHLSNLDRPAAFAGAVAGFAERVARAA